MAAPAALPAGEVARTIPGCKMPCGKPCVNSRFGTKCNVKADCCDPSTAYFTGSEYGPVCHCRDRAPVVHVVSDAAACLKAMAAACPGQQGKGKDCYSPVHDRQISCCNLAKLKQEAARLQSAIPTCCQ